MIGGCRNAAGARVSRWRLSWRLRGRRRALPSRRHRVEHRQQRSPCWERPCTRTHPQAAISTQHPPISALRAQPESPSSLQGPPLGARFVSPNTQPQAETLAWTTRQHGRKAISVWLLQLLWQDGHEHASARGLRGSCSSPSSFCAASEVCRGARLRGDSLRGADGGEAGTAVGDDGGVVGELQAVPPPLPGSNLSASLRLERELVASCVTAGRLSRSPTARHESWPDTHAEPQPAAVAIRPEDFCAAREASLSCMMSCKW